MNKRKVNENMAMTLSSGKHDAVINNVIVQGLQDRSVIVTAKSDLDNLDGYSVGTFAYTAGMANIWQLDASGEWQPIIEEAGT